MQAVSLSPIPSPAPVMPAPSPVEAAAGAPNFATVLRDTPMDDPSRQPQDAPSDAPIPCDAAVLPSPPPILQSDPDQAETDSKSRSTEDRGDDADSVVPVTDGALAATVAAMPLLPDPASHPPAATVAKPSPPPTDAAANVETAQVAAEWQILTTPDPAGLVSLSAAAQPPFPPDAASPAVPRFPAAPPGPGPQPDQQSSDDPGLRPILQPLMPAITPSATPKPDPVAKTPANLQSPPPGASDPAPVVMIAPSDPQPAQAIPREGAIPAHWVLHLAETPADSAAPQDTAPPSDMGRKTVSASPDLTIATQPPPPPADAALHRLPQAPATVSAPPVLVHLPQTLGTDLAAVVAKRPDGPVDISLAPEELGRLRIRLTPEGEGLRVTVQVERHETLDLLRRNADVLMQEIRAAGFTGSSFSFSGWTGTAQGGPAQQTSTQVPLPSPENPAPAPHQHHAPASGPQTGLDLRL